MDECCSFQEAEGSIYGEVIKNRSITTLLPTSNFYSYPFPLFAKKIYKQGDDQIIRKPFYDKYLG